MPWISAISQSTLDNLYGSIGFCVALDSHELFLGPFRQDIIAISLARSYG